MKKKPFLSLLVLFACVVTLFIGQSYGAAPAGGCSGTSCTQGTNPNNGNTVYYNTRFNVNGSAVCCDNVCSENFQGSKKEGTSGR